MNKQKLIDSVQFIFDRFKDLKVLPIIAWGRYYRYERAGSPFETDTYQFSDFQNMDIEYEHLDWKLLKEINKIYYNKQPNDEEFRYKVESIELPSREECVKEYDFDDRGGEIVLVVKDENGKLSVESARCDSPE